MDIYRETVQNELEPRQNRDVVIMEQVQKLRKYTKHRAHNTETKNRESGDSDTDVGLIVTHALSVGATNTSGDWVVDSGATCHICNDINRFTNICVLEKSIDVTVGDGFKLKARKQGNISTRIKLPGGKSRKCTLHDVLYVPELSYSLFSVSKATKRGITVTFDDTKCFLLDKDQEIVAEGVKKGRLYYLECDLPHIEKVNSIETNQLWHRRYGHLSSKYLQLLAKKELATGLKDYDYSKSIDLCEPCISGKHHRSQFPTSERRAKEVLELIHSDVCGKLDSKSLGRGEYFLTFIDDFSRYTCVTLTRFSNNVKRTDG